MANTSSLFGPGRSLNLQNGFINADGSITKNDGAKNYVTYNNFELASTNGWNLFSTTLTNNLPTGSITLSAASLTLGTTTTNPLAGTTSLQLASAAAWTAGQGIISNAFTVDREDLGKVLSFKINYEAVSGAANANWSGMLGSQTLSVYIYDLTAGTWLQPSGFLGLNQSSYPGLASGNFQASIVSGQQYQIAIFASVATAAALTVNFDDIYLGPQVIAIGTPSTSPQAYVPTFTGFGTPTVSFADYYMIGAYGFVEFQITQGTNTAVAASISLPAGWVIDTTLEGVNQVVGTWGASATPFVGNMFLQTGTSTTLVYFSSGSAAFNTALNGSTWANATVVSGSIKVKLAGKSQNVQMSSDTDTRVVAASYYSTTASSYAANTAPLNFSTAAYDTHSAVTTGASWRFNAPISGIYHVLVNGAAASQAGNTVVLYKNGAVTGSGRYIVTFSGTNYQTSGAQTIQLNAGDYIDLRIDGSFTVTPGTISIYRLSGPAVVQNTESVNARYYGSSSTISSTLSTVVYMTKGWDTHGGYQTTGGNAGSYIVPVSGKYLVNASVSSSASYVLNSILVIQVAQSGSATQTTEQDMYAANGVTAINVSTSDTFYCAAGDLLTIKVSNSGSSPAIVASTARNWFSVQRIGN